MRLTIAIDGPASSGKGTLAKNLARALGYRYVDTGAMYRAVAWAAARRGVDWGDAAGLAAVAASLRFDFRWDGAALRVWVDDEDVTAAIRADDVSRGASLVSAHPPVRQALLGLQRALGGEGGVVMDGRDVGTVILPDAHLKVYLDASLDERARRRHAELVRDGQGVTLDEVRDAIALRDRRDVERASAPLTQAADAVYVDSTGREAVDVLAEVRALAAARGAD